ncbi:ABC transporter, ATP-binding protein [hydrothermal vent metagenome]|uniref:ABC transporter, ATP-binding protein n=1 Tax=hydrothermal vent metagenome TaxID=652676 RepID=A0A3B0TF36_9ZZZZ
MSQPLIKTTNANLRMQNGDVELHILNDINLQVDAAEVVAIVGPSGSGKTSMLMVLSGLEKATGGSIFVAGQDLSQLNEDQLAIFRRKNLGILFQNFHLISSMSALENVALALEIAETGISRAKIRDAATKALDEVGLGERVNHLPSALSGGEQQRVGLARAMVTKPRLLLADEPTGNLDQDTGALVIKLMFELARKQNTAVMLITHDNALAKKADRTLIMDHGQLSQKKSVTKKTSAKQAKTRQAKTSQTKAKT